MNATLAAHAIFSSGFESTPTIDRPAPKSGTMPRTRALPAARPGQRSGDHHLREVVRDMRYLTSLRPRW